MAEPALLVWVWILIACTDNAHPSFLSLDVYGLQTAPLQRLLLLTLGNLPFSFSVCSDFTSCVTLQNKHTELPGYCFSIREPSPLFLCPCVFVFSSFPDCLSQSIPAAVLNTAITGMFYHIQLMRGLGLTQSYVHSRAWHNLSKPVFLLSDTFLRLNSGHQPHISPFTC